MHPKVDPLSYLRLVPCFLDDSTFLAMLKQLSISVVVVSFFLYLINILTLNESMIEDF